MEKVASNLPKPFLKSEEENPKIPQLYHRVPDSRALLYKQYVRSLGCPTAVVTPYDALKRGRPETSSVPGTGSSKKTKKNKEERKKKKSKQKPKKRSRCKPELKKLERIAEEATNDTSDYC